MKALKEENGLDGIDLDIESSGSSAELQTFLIKALRDKCGPDFHITYTIPALTFSIEPWMSTIVYGIEHMDAINIMAYDVYWDGYNYMMDIEGLEEIGVPRVVNCNNRKNNFLETFICPPGKMFLLRVKFYIFSQKWCWE